MIVLDEAIKHADENYDDYYLVLYLQSGTVIRGSHFKPTSDSWIRLECPNEQGEMITTFVNTASIEAIEIEQ